MRRACFLLVTSVRVLTAADPPDLKLVVSCTNFRQHKKLQAKAAKKEQQALKEIEDSGAKVRPPPTVVPRDVPLSPKKLANFYKSTKPKADDHDVSAEAEAAAAQAALLQSSTTMADQQVRKFLVKK